MKFKARHTKMNLAPHPGRLQIMPNFGTSILSESGLRIFEVGIYVLTERVEHDLNIRITLNGA